MDADDATVGTILTRRQALALAMRGSVGTLAWSILAGAARADSRIVVPPPVNLVATPVMTEGPFFVDEKLNRSDLLSGTARPSVLNGLPLLLGITVYQLVGKECKPVKDAQVDVWHTDANGVYSDENNPMNHEDTSKQTWLRGYQMTDADGLAAFKTIYPGWYPARTAHIHFKIRHFGVDGNSASEFTSQFFFDEEQSDRVYAEAPYNSRGQRKITNKKDGIYSEKLADGSAAGSHLMLTVEKNPEGKGDMSKFAILLTPENTHGGRRPRGGRPPGPPPGDRPRV
jgi:protocatechuate 3,4-dioxygenase beta subunit